MAAQSTARSDAGLKRKHNEDSFLDRPDIGLWAVADGMGGATAGDVASRAVVAALDAIGEAGSAPALMAEVVRRIHAVNAELRAMALARGEDVMIGSTVAGLVIHGGHFACFWAGDSRVYRLRRGELDRLTRDHSLVQEMVDAGVLAPDEAERHPRASVITRAVGIGEELVLACVHAAVEPGDRFLMCSDGLTRVVGDEELERHVGAQRLAAVGEDLVALVLQRGAPDNVTVVVVEV